MDFINKELIPTLQNILPASWTGAVAPAVAEATKKVSFAAKVAAIKAAEAAAEAAPNVVE
jgi:hypothetical protein